MKLALFIGSRTEINSRDYYGSFGPGFFIVDDASGAVCEVEVEYWMAIPPIPKEAWMFETDREGG